MNPVSVVDGPSAAEMLDADVRDQVRHSGVDPLTDVEAVRKFARSSVLAHDQRSLSGVGRPIEDPDQVVEELVARVAGFGPLQRYLNDRSFATDIRSRKWWSESAVTPRGDPVYFGERFDTDGHRVVPAHRPSNIAPAGTTEGQPAGLAAS